MQLLLSVLASALTTIVPLSLTVKCLDPAIANQIPHTSYQILLNYWLYYITLQFINLNFVTSHGQLFFDVVSNATKLWLLYGHYNNLAVLNALVLDRISLNNLEEKYIEPFLSKYITSTRLDVPRNRRISQLHCLLIKFGNKYANEDDGGQTLVYVDRIISSIKMVIAPLFQPTQRVTSPPPTKRLGRRSNQRLRSNSNSKSIRKVPSSQSITSMGSSGSSRSGSRYYDPDALSFSEIMGSSSNNRASSIDRVRYTHSASPPYPLPHHQNPVVSENLTNVPLNEFMNNKKARSVSEKLDAATSKYFGMKPRSSSTGESDARIRHTADGTRGVFVDSSTPSTFKVNQNSLKSIKQDSTTNELPSIAVTSDAKSKFYHRFTS
ncbi:uncharacterized protein RJT20DRAFT_34244 [Scheffersomyces xylosifermentans]|uniref:uncharacterized protein n=1 Tax=Scheffersomyces xylosifermentans TaxID=1304137 RepID=UPI00315D255A